jgi:hypothetical protein
LAPPSEPDGTLWVVLMRSKNAGPLKYEKREKDEASKTSNGASFLGVDGTRAEAFTQPSQVFTQPSQFGHTSPAIT